MCEGWRILMAHINTNTYGKNLKAFTSKLFFVNASRMSSSDTVVLWLLKRKTEKKKTKI